METEIIVGPPGTGKTTYLMQVMEKEMSHGVYPEEIAFVSFTKKAAKEAITRAKDTFKLRTVDFPYIRTLHSLAFMELGIQKQEMMSAKNYSELGDYLGLEFSNKLGNYHEDYSIESVKFSGDRYVYLDGFARARQMTPEQTWELLGDYDVNWLEYERYTRTVREYKRENGLIDFSDLLAGVCEPLKIKVAIIDEAQDLSTLQWKFAQGIFRNVERLYIAGDDDQAIYTWSGADVNYFLNMPGKRTILHQSHRIPKAVHDLASTITDQIENRIEKKYNPTDQPGVVKYHTDIDHVDFSEGSWLLLARNGYMLNRLVMTMREQGYLYSYRDDSVVNKSHLRAITAWEKWRRGSRLTTDEAQLVESYLPPGTKEWPEVIWHEALTKIRPSDRQFYVSLLRRGEKLTQKPRINISTIHGVKGGEADNVLLTTDTAPKTLEGFRNQPDNEHRVWYVGATRAKEALHILMPQTANSYAL